MKSCIAVKAITSVKGRAKYPFFLLISSPKAGRNCPYISKIGLVIRAEIFSSNSATNSSSQNFLGKITMTDLYAQKVGHSEMTIKEGLGMYWRMSEQQQGHFQQQQKQRSLGGVWMNASQQKPRAPAQGLSANHIQTYTLPESHFPNSK